MSSLKFPTMQILEPSTTKGRVDKNISLNLTFMWLDFIIFEKLILCIFFETLWDKRIVFGMPWNNEI
jgi:hypothetical protein